MREHRCNFFKFAASVETGLLGQGMSAHEFRFLSRVRNSYIYMHGLIGCYGLVSRSQTTFSAGR